jgi:hypothetical protein
MGFFHMYVGQHHTLTLYSMGYGCYPMGEPCRSRSAGISILSDQDLNCSLLDHEVSSDQKANSIDRKADGKDVIRIYLCHT